MIFTRDDHARGHAPRHGDRIVQDAVDAEAHAQVASVGRQVDVGGVPLDRLGHDLVDELDDRSVVRRFAQVDDLGPPGARLLVLDVGDDVVQPVEPADQREDVIRARRRPGAPRSRS